MVFERKLNFATAKISIFFSQNVGGRDYVFFFNFFSRFTLVRVDKNMYVCTIFYCKRKSTEKNKSMSNQNVML